jgi:thymidylate synthase (FAD)
MEIPTYPPPDDPIPREIKCLDHGFVALVDWMGNDRTPAQCARTSFRNAQQERTDEQDAKLTDYLVRHKHTTPIEFCQVRFYMKMPIFVARQLVRHRTASINEVSYRYVQAAREFYVPEVARLQRKPETNKQGSSEALVENPALCTGVIRDAGNAAFDAYAELLREGLAPEIARIVLPCGTYTEWYWQNDLHNTLHMLGLRLDPHAQYEIRVFAQACLDLLRPIYPTIITAWGKARAA